MSGVALYSGNADMTGEKIGIALDRLRDSRLLDFLICARKMHDGNIAKARKKK
jgi:hypothetical protein